MNRPVRRLVPVALAAALSLTACGSGHPSGTATQGPQAADLYAAARRSAVSANSAHVTGSVHHRGVTSTIDLVGNRSGSNSRVVLRTGDDGPVEIRVVDGATYLKGDRAYWAEAGRRPHRGSGGRPVRPAPRGPGQGAGAHALQRPGPGVHARRSSARSTR